MNQETTTSLIDTALASGSATALDPEERALQELVLAVRDDAPTPDPDFRLRMDARVAAGFPARRRLRVTWPAFAAKRPQMAALGVAASLLIAVVVVASQSDGGSNPPVPADTLAKVESPTAEDASGGGAASSGSASSGGAATVESTAKKAKAAPSEDGAGGVAAGAPPEALLQDSVVGPTPVPNGAVRGGSKRRVERSAALTLAAPKDKLNDVGNQVLAVTDRYRGIVMRSTVTAGNDQVAGGQFDLRIPVQNLAPALRDLSALADVQSRTENADDVTSSFVSAHTRIEELKAERRSLLRRLAAATTDIAVQQLRYRLRIVNAQLDSESSSLQRLRRRTNLATVSVSLVPKRGSGTTTGGLGDGIKDLRHSLVDSANTALRVLGVALPIALLIALLWGGNAWITRRRRETALDRI